MHIEIMYIIFDTLLVGDHRIVTAPTAIAQLARKDKNIVSLLGSTMEGFESYRD